jgi:hypothetical protein
MQVRRKKAFRELYRLIRTIESDPNDLASVRKLNLLIVKQVLQAEQAILRHRQTQRDLNKQLKTGRGTKQESQAIRAKLARVSHYIAAQDDQLFIWRCFGDALAYVYLDKFSIKHAFFETDSWGIKEDAGMLTGKEGLSGEVSLLIEAINARVPAVLCDITNTLRHGDVCLLGGSDPFLIEVKSSPKMNKRGKRQMAKLERLHSFLESDEAVDFRGSNGVTRRVNLAVPERDHVSELNECITRAKLDGECIVHPEPGVTYVAVYGQSDFDVIGAEIKGSSLAVFMLNADKNDHTWPPYTPFILNIKNEDHLLDFIEGRLFLIVLIDMQKLCDLIADDEWAVRYRPDHNYPIQCMHRRTKMYMGISHQFVARAGYEFMSLGWIADQHRSSAQRFEKMANELGPSAAPQAQAQLLTEMFGPDDEWARHIAQQTD